VRKEKPADSPDAYVAALDGWRRETVETLRAAVPFLIRAEEARVLFGFLRGRSS
jgi:hypothetical protein